jgi:hypothetical protein
MPGFSNRTVLGLSKESGYLDFQFISTASVIAFGFTLSFFFPEHLHCCYIDFHCSYLYNYYNSSPTLCIIKCWDWFSISHWVSGISYWDLIKFPYFCEYHLKEGLGGERQGEDRVTLPTSLLSIFIDKLVTSIINSLGHWWNFNNKGELLQGKKFNTQPIRDLPRLGMITY